MGWLRNRFLAIAALLLAATAVTASVALHIGMEQAGYRTPPGAWIQAGVASWIVTGLLVRQPAIFLLSATFALLALGATARRWVPDFNIQQLWWLVCAAQAVWAGLLGKAALGRKKG